MASELSPKALVHRTMGNLLLLCVVLVKQNDITEQLLKCLQFLLRVAGARVCVRVFVHNLLTHDRAEKRGSPLVAYKFSAAVLRMVAANPVALLGSEAGRNAVLAVLRYATFTAEAAANALLTVKCGGELFGRLLSCCCDRADFL